MLWNKKETRKVRQSHVYNIAGESVTNLSYPMSFKGTKDIQRRDTNIFTFKGIDIKIFN